MPSFPTTELVELFFQEFDSYIPEIRQGLDTLSSDNTALPVIQELHRLFHNIKGAASQVQLTDLSKGARVVETALERVVEEEQAIFAPMLQALYRTVELLIAYSNTLQSSPGEGQDFHRQMVCLFSSLPGDEEAGRDWIGPGLVGQQDYLQEVRSILPLLHQLAGCLSGDGGGNGHDRSVYGKLSHAVSLLSTTLQAAGMQRQSRMMQDFHLLLERLHTAAIPHQLEMSGEMSGVLQDLLRFLEVIFAHEDPERSPAITRMCEQLKRCDAILGALGHQQEMGDPAGETPGFEATNIFDEPLPDDQTIEFLAELEDSELHGQGSEEEFDVVDPFVPVPEEAAKDEPVAEEPVDEEQLLLMEIFQEECDEHLIVINQGLNSLENQVKEPTALTPALKESISDIRRAVHTLKGAASMTGVNLLAKGAHALEDMLDWLHDTAEQLTPQEVQLIASGIDVIELLSQTPQATASARLTTLIDSLNGYLAARPEPQKIEEIAADPAVSGVAAGAAVLKAKADIASRQETAVVTETPAALPGDSGTLRVRLDDLDELVSIEGELVVARGAMEQMVAEFNQTLVELDKVKENLRRKAQELESGFEVQALYGFYPVGAQGGSEQPSNGELAEFDSIELDRYSELNLIIRSLNEIAVDVGSIHTTLATLAGDLGGQLGKQQLTMRLMQDKMMRIRMTPLSSISRVLFRTVRDTARKLGKKVALTISGEDVYMDRFVWARITDPLMHILRNGVDHGIEPAEVRLAAGKPETGNIKLQAEQRSRYVVLRIADDGGGINFTRIRDKIRREGLAENPEVLDEKDLLEYLFFPSFTTREDITTISGRGVGLDVVKRNIQDLRGSIQIHDNAGQGVVFEIAIPFTLSVNRAAMVSVAGRVFAIPLQDILQIRHFTARELEANEGMYLTSGSGLVPMVNLGFYLQLEKRMETSAPGTGGLAILFLKGEKQYAVAIDSVIEQREIVVKNLGSHLSHVRGISGVTLTGSGGMIPILNLRELVAVPETVSMTDSELPLPLHLDEPLKVLIVDDSISVRHSVARLVESRSWVQQQAVDGLDALAKLESFLPDVIILDIEMPRMNGYEFKSSINNQHRYKDIPIVMLTSRVSDKHQQKARELGIEHYMTKPYQDDSFVRLLEGIRSGS